MLDLGCTILCPPYLSWYVLKIAKEKLVENKGKEIALKETCFYCGQLGHWKKNCKAYMESKKNVACDAPSSSGI